MPLVVAMPQAELWTVDEQQSMTNATPGVGVRRVPTDDCISLIWGTMRRGTNESEHAHPYDQWVLTLKGMARFTCGGEVFIVKRGDVLKIPAGVRHSAYYITDTEAIAFGLGQD